MAISGIGNNYNNMYEGAYAAQKNETAKKAEAKNTVSAQAGSTKSAGKKVTSDYCSYLQKNYGCMSKENVTISDEYMKKCSKDSNKAKELEDFLKKIPELEKQGYEQLSAQNKALGGKVTYYSQTWTINKDGSIQSTVYSVTETGMTNAERMKKSMDERLEKQNEKKAEEKTEKQNEEKQEQRNTISKLENTIKDGLKNHPPKIIQAEQKEIEISSDIMTEKMKRLEKQLKDGTFKTNSNFDLKA